MRHRQHASYARIHRHNDSVVVFIDNYTPHRSTHLTAAEAASIGRMLIRYAKDVESRKWHDSTLPGHVVIDEAATETTQ